MRKLLKTLVVLGIISAATTAFSAPTSGYSIAPYTKNFNKALFGTNIAVLNQSTNLIYASVPGLTYTLFSGGNVNFTHPNYDGWTTLTLQDPYYVTFWSQPVCRFAVVFVEGRPGYYRTTVDSRYC